jgi:mono/diheme cytochrome c family protein
MDLLVNLANADERTTFFCELIASSVYQKEGMVLPFLNQVELREIILNWQERAASKSPPPKVPSLGAKVFSNFCVACHGGNGEGVPLLAPPFDGSEWLLMEDEVLIKIVLEGLIGPIKVAGKDYNLAMPPLLTLSNEEIAGVLTYIRQQWAPSAKPISADAVAKLRQGL